MIIESPICLGCEHFNSLDNDKLSCKAFPDGIPEEILSGENDHTKPLPKQDNDIVFEEKKRD